MYYSTPNIMYFFQNINRKCRKNVEYGTIQYNDDNRMTIFLYKKNAYCNLELSIVKLLTGVVIMIQLNDLLQIATLFLCTSIEIKSCTFRLRHALGSILLPNYYPRYQKKTHIEINRPCDICS